MEKYYEIVQDQLKQNKSIVSVTVVETKGSAPQRAGAKMIVSESGELLWGTVGGGTIEDLAIKQAIEQIAKTTPLLKSYELLESGVDATGMLCGGEMLLFFEPVGNKTKAYIFGAGHITQQLIPLIQNLRYNPIIIDDRSDYLEKKIEQNIQKITLLGDIEDSLQRIEFEEGSYLIIMTYSHDLDEKILTYLLTEKTKEIDKLKYLGLIGSKRKIREIFNRLESKGVDRKILDSIHAPIGISIRSQTPEEIAISITAEMISIRNKEVSANV
ncbi:MAG: XdhC family protein [Candidatus Hodarchaeales archaeon]